MKRAWLAAITVAVWSGMVIVEAAAAKWIKVTGNPEFGITYYIDTDSVSWSGEKAWFIFEYASSSSRYRKKVEVNCRNYSRRTIEYWLHNSRNGQYENVPVSLELWKGAWRVTPPGTNIYNLVNLVCD
jgi:hypothetical protein